MIKYTEFYKIILPFEKNLFDELYHSVQFEDINKGRVGNHLVNVLDNEPNNGVPIVRTTTQYNVPAHYFSNIHHLVVASINSIIKEENINNNEIGSLPEMSFNNALIEIYDKNYFKMNYHSDQCLDLDENSYIALFSCYERPNDLSEQNLRKLKIKNKTTNEEFEILLTHNSVVLFSVPTNSNFLHKIVLEPALNLKPLTLDNKWLGITFRKSKTFIQFKNNLPYFSEGELLTLADENQQKAFYKLRSEENNILNFIYPKLTYTLNLSDMMLPI